MYELILVSQSPRRRQLLENAGFLFRVDTVKISEIIEENVNLATAISTVAMTKAQAYIKQHNHLKSQKIILLSADTMVCIDGRALGKPKNNTEAQAFLTQLSGRKHEVITGIYLSNLYTGEEFTGHVTTKVQFKKITLGEIQTYILSGEPMDKAGAYAIQGEGKKFVENIEGSYSNVVGLPMEYFEEVLKDRGWDVARRTNSNC